MHDGRLPFLQQLQQFSSPKQYAAKVLSGHKFARGMLGLPGKEGLFIADVDAAKSILAFELQLGVGGDWPPTFQAMLGHSSISMTTDLELHSKLRQYMGMAFTDKSVQAMLPDLQATAAALLARLAAATADSTSTSASTGSNSSSGSTGAEASTDEQQQQQPVGLFMAAGEGRMVLGYPAVRMLMFDVLVNRVLGLRMSDAEVQTYAGLFETLVDGFVPPAWDLPFTAYGKGLQARRLLTQRIQQTLSSSNCSPALARLRDEFGADSPVAIDNTISLLFAGFDTTSSSLTFMFGLLAQNPEVLEKVHAEQLDVVARCGPSLTSEAYKSMPYTMAVIKETLRLAQIVGYVPRMATRELSVPGGPVLPSGCPFLVALAAISDADPAIQQAGDGEVFRPERWLDPAAAQSLAQHQLPFGMGQRTCLGINLALAEMAAVLSELGRSYSLTADWQTEWKDFPIKRPGNGLPLRLEPRTAAASAAAAVAAAVPAAAQA